MDSSVHKAVADSEIGNQDYVAMDLEMAHKTMSLPIHKLAAMVGLFYFYPFFVLQVNRVHSNTCIPP